MYILNQTKVHSPLVNPERIFDLKHLLACLDSKKDPYVVAKTGMTLSYVVIILDFLVEYME